jgi:hypothetical protein
MKWESVLNWTFLWSWWKIFCIKLALWAEKCLMQKPKEKETVWNTKLPLNFVMHCNSSNLPKVIEKLDVTLLSYCTSWSLPALAFKQVFYFKWLNGSSFWTFPKILACFETKRDLVCDKYSVVILPTCRYEFQRETHYAWIWQWNWMK